VKKINDIIIVISIFTPMLIGLILTDSSNDDLAAIGVGFLLLSIGLIIIFISNNKTILIPTNLNKINFKIILYIFIISSANFISTVCIVCIARFIKIGNFSIIGGSDSLNIISIIDTIIFAFLHCFSLTSVKFYEVIVGGIVLGYIFYCTKFILTSILCHGTYNFITVLFSNFIFYTKSTSTFIGCIFLEVFALALIVYLIKKINKFRIINLE
jgi:membrane protease YdiL (CAAX protease family)